MAIHFYFHEVPARLKHRLALKQAIRRLFEREHRDLESLDYIFCSDAYLLTINQQYLKHDTLTDIITFDLSEAGGGIRAEIYISQQRVEENAREFGSGFVQELHRVIFHGALHLCGYKDKTESQKALMRHKEQQCLDLYFKS